MDFPLIIVTDQEHDQHYPQPQFKVVCVVTYHANYKFSCLVYKEGAATPSFEHLLNSLSCRIKAKRRKKKKSKRTSLKLSSECITWHFNACISVRLLQNSPSMCCRKVGIDSDKHKNAHQK